jgi:FMN phosphatase YigB (HAD superfamily)
MKIVYIDMDNVLVDFQSGIDYLIDDRLANGASEFKGEHIHFGKKPFTDWGFVLSYLVEGKALNQ